MWPKLVFFWLMGPTCWCLLAAFWHRSIGVGCLLAERFKMFDLARNRNSNNNINLPLNSWLWLTAYNWLILRSDTRSINMDSSTSSTSPKASNISLEMHISSNVFPRLPPQTGFTNFTIFPKLPDEIKYKIWKQATEDIEARVVEACFVKSSDR